MTKRGVKSLTYGVLALLLALFVFVFGMSSLLKTRYVSSHQSVSATIISKEERQAKGRFTVIIADYWHGATHCTAARFKLPGWSSDYNVGNVLRIFPRDNTCNDPITSFDIRTPPTAFAIALFFLLSVGIGLIWFAFRDMPVNANERV